MKYYFSLQFRVLCRHIKANGINPYFAFSFLVIVFIFLSLSFFKQSAYAPYVYALLPLTFLSAAGGQRRNEFLQITFTKKNLRQVRMVENAIMVLPFIFILIFKLHFILSVALLVLALLISLVTFKARKASTIPTPFYQFPFEFPSGFRKSYLGIIISYALIIIGIYIGNFNLALVAMALQFLIVVSYYNLPENEFYVWIYSKSPKQFLISKMKIATLYSFCLVIPAMILMLLFFSSHGLIIGGIFLSGLLIVNTALLGKYALFPSEVNLTQIICLLFSILFPPLMIIILPILYFTSLKRLKPILK